MYVCMYVCMLGREAAVVGREAADRATKSREVDLSRLKGFHLRFAPKMRSGVTCKITFGSAESIGFTPTKKIERVCVSPGSKEQICLLCTKEIRSKDFKRKLTISGGKKKDQSV